MEMEHKFTVPAPIDTVWEALLDLENVVPCMPGATLTSFTGEEFEGTVKVRLGPISLLYKGSGKFASKDPAAHKAVIEAAGKDSRGNGTANATVTASMAEQGGETAVTVVTDLAITGKPAQFGRGMIAEVGGKIIGKFADCLAGKLDSSQQEAPAGAASSAAPSGGAAEPASASQASTGQAPPAGSTTPGAPPAAAARPVRPVPASVDSEIDLLDAAGASVVKRVAPVVAGVLLLLLIIRWMRR